MNRLIPVFLVAACMNGLAALEPTDVSPAPAPAPHPDWASNSVLFYWRGSFFLQEEPDFLKRMTKAFEHIRTELPPDDAAQEDSSALKCLLSGANMPGGDFGGIPALYAMNFDDVMPEMRAMKDLAVCCIMRARWRFEHGRNREAIIDCMAVQALSADLCRNSTMIDALLGINLQGMLDRTLQRYLPRCGVEDCQFIATTLLDPRHTRSPIADECLNEVDHTIWMVIHFSESDETRLLSLVNGLGKGNGTHSTLADPAKWITACQVVLAATPEQRQRWCDEAFAPFKGISRLTEMPDPQFGKERDLMLKPQPLAAGNPLAVMVDNFKEIIPMLLNADRSGRVHCEFLARAAKAIHGPSGLMGLDGSSIRGRVVHLVKTGDAISFTIGEGTGNRGYQGAIGTPLPMEK